MHAKIKIHDPSQVKCTMELTMELREWVMLEQQLIKQCPSIQFSSKIITIIRMAIQEFFAEEEG